LYPNNNVTTTQIVKGSNLGSWFTTTQAKLAVSLTGEERISAQSSSVVMSVLADGLEKTRTRTFHPDGLSFIGTFDYLRRCHIVIRVQESPNTKASEHQ
jgi:hypothetical protein